MANIDNLTITIRLKIGWRWRLATKCLPPLVWLGLPARACVPVLNWALRGFRWSSDGRGWAPLFEGNEVELKHLG